MDRRPLFGLTAAIGLGFGNITHAGGYGLFSGHKKRVASKDRSKVKKARKQRHRRK